MSDLSRWTSDSKGERERVAEQSGAMEPRKTAEPRERHCTAGQKQFCELFLESLEAAGLRTWIARFLPKAKMAPIIIVRCKRTKVHKAFLTDEHFDNTI